MSETKQTFLEDLNRNNHTINELYFRTKVITERMRESELPKAMMIDLEGTLEILRGLSKTIAVDNWRLSVKNAKLVKEIEELKKQISEKEEIAL